MKRGLPLEVLEACVAALLMIVLVAIDLTSGVTNDCGRFPDLEAEPPDNEACATAIDVIRLTLEQKQRQCVEPMTDADFREKFRAVSSERLQVADGDDIMMSWGGRNHSWRGWNFWIFVEEPTAVSRVAVVAVPAREKEFRDVSRWRYHCARCGAPSGVKPLPRQLGKRLSNALEKGGLNSRAFWQVLNSAESSRLDVGVHMDNEEAFNRIYSYLADANGLRTELEKNELTAMQIRCRLGEFFKNDVMALNVVSSHSWIVCSDGRCIIAASQDSRGNAIKPCRLADLVVPKFQILSDPEDFPTECEIPIDFDANNHKIALKPREVDVTMHNIVLSEQGEGTMKIQDVRPPESPPVLSLISTREVNTHVDDEESFEKAYSYLADAKNGLRTELEQNDLTAAQIRCRLYDHFKDDVKVSGVVLSHAWIVCSDGRCVIAAVRKRNGETVKQCRLADLVVPKLLVLDDPEDFPVEGEIPRDFDEDNYSARLKPRESDVTQNDNEKYEEGDKNDE